MAVPQCAVVVMKKVILGVLFFAGAAIGGVALALRALVNSLGF